MKALGIWFGAACIALVLVPPAQAHKLTAKKAEAALQPAAEQMPPQVAPKIAAVLPGATITDTSVDCQVARRKHRANCTIDYTITGASTGETGCSQPAIVAFRSKTSKQLKVSIAPAVACFFVVPLE
jgi:hypothetical protein